MVAEELFLRVVKVKYIPCISRSQAIKLRCCPSDCQSDKFIEHVYVIQVRVHVQMYCVGKILAFEV